MNPLVLHHSNFANNEFGHGGEKRTAQILEILTSSNIDSFNLNITPNLTRLEKIKQVYGFSFSNLTSRQSIISKIKENWLISANREPFSLSRFLLWESTFESNSWLLNAAKRQNKKIIALPHNLESLVPGQISAFSKKTSPNWLLEEINLLSKCDNVFVLSREEQWLLRLFNIDANFLPYYPTEKAYSYLLAIRNNREVEDEPQDSILLMGSAGNTPTFQGMKNRIDAISKSSAISKFKVHVVGYYTEKLKQYCNHKNFIFHGPLSNDAMAKLFQKIKFAIIHQPPSSGALTRVPELLISGIPIILNANAGRTFYNLEGVNIYDTESDFEDLIHLDFKTPPIPEKKISFETQLTSLIQ